MAYKEVAIFIHIIRHDEKPTENHETPYFTAPIKMYILPVQLAAFNANSWVVLEEI